MKELAVFVGLMMANFAVQAFHTNPDYLRAFEVSYFQGLALLTMWICRKIDKVTQ